MSVTFAEPQTDARFNSQPSATPNRRRRRLPELAESVATPPSIPTIAGLPDEHETELAELRSAFSEWRSNYAATVNLPSKNVEDFLRSFEEDDESNGGGWLFAVAESTRLSLFAHIESMAKLCHRAAEALNATVAPLTEAVDKAKAEHEKATQKAAEALKKAGAGPESQQAWPNYPEAAERQFAAKVRECGPVREAATVVDTANGAVQAATNLARQFTRCRNDAIAVLKEAAEGAVEV